jgi:hypothetical protein
MKTCLMIVAIAVAFSAVALLVDMPKRAETVEHKCEVCGATMVRHPRNESVLYCPTHNTMVHVGHGWMQ